MTEAERGTSEATCPVCNRPDATTWMLEKNGCQLYRCGVCDHIFVFPMPSLADLERIYSFDSGYMVQETQRFSGLTRFPPKFERVLDHVRKHVSSGSVLDVGCSTGLFLYMAKRAGFNVLGLEINKDTAAIARANDIDVIVGTLSDAPLERRTFDVVHLGDVLEHVGDPADLLVRIRAMLKPGGIAVITTPNHDAFFPRSTWMLHRRLGLPWSHPTPPHHLNQFSLRSLTRLLEGLGYTVRDQFFAPCALAYEIRATGVPSSARNLARQRRYAHAALEAAKSGVVALAYSMVWLADRLPRAGLRDFEMTVIAGMGNTGPR